MAKKNTEDKDFDRFWEQYPRRVGKLAAQAEWKKARQLANADDILAGVERYKVGKPTYADWCHPRTWLHHGRWMDEYEETAATSRSPWRCDHVEHCSHRDMCRVKHLVGPQKYPVKVRA